MNIHAQPNPVTLPERRDLFYGGGWHVPAKNKRTGTINPSTGESLGEVGWADAEDVDHAVKAAYRGFQTWRAVKPLERAKILRAVAQLIRKHGRELALIDSANCGNPIREMVRDAEFGATSIDFFAGLATEIKGDTIPMGGDALNYTVREPLGVVVRVNAYNHPFLFATMKIGAPLVAGNSIVIKPPIIAAVSAIKPGLPTDDATEMGCLVSKAQFEKVMGYIAAGQADGAKLVAGGKKPDDPQLTNGFYIEPAIFAGVTPQMRIAKEEIFGPVLSVFKWRDENEMFEAVNAVDYGLTASIWTKDLKTAHCAAARVEVGFVWVNTVGAHFLGAPFGGYKQSGMGREESADELLEYTQIKNVNIAL